MNWRHPYQNRSAALSAGLASMVIIAFLDRFVYTSVSLGPLYLGPSVLMAGHLRGHALAALCVLCTILREWLGPYQFDSDFLPRNFFALTSYLTVSFFVRHVALSRKQAQMKAWQLTEEVQARTESEQWLKAVLGNTPIAILVAAPGGEILMANPAAIKLFRLEGPVRGNLVKLVPALRSYLETATGAGPLLLEAPARRADGESFLARGWVSHFESASRRIAAIAVADVSEDMRENQAAGLESMMYGARTVLGAVSHEIRNLSAALSIAVRNLERRISGEHSADVATLRSLARAIAQLASTQMNMVNPRRDVRAEVGRVVNQLILSAGADEVRCAEGGPWSAGGEEMWVAAEHAGLLQVLLNLVNNATRACEEAGLERECRIDAGRANGRVWVRVSNRGRPLSEEVPLFEPFRQGAEGTGLGLYVSRAILRSFGGDLRHEPSDVGPSFVIDLVAVENARAVREAS